MACSCILIKKEHLGSGNYRWTFSCTKDDLPSKIIEEYGGNEDAARTMAESDCQNESVKEVQKILMLKKYADILPLIELEDREKFNSYYKELTNPLYFKDIKLSSTIRDHHKLGGGSNVTRSGERVTLGSGTCGANITVGVGGNASLTIEMWFTLAQIPAGTWKVSGPQGSTFQLNCNTITVNPLGCPNWFGLPVTICAVGENGSFPVWVSF